MWNISRLENSVVSVGLELCSYNHLTFFFILKDQSEIQRLANYTYQQWQFAEASLKTRVWEELKVLPTFLVRRHLDEFQNYSAICQGQMTSDPGPIARRWLARGW